MALAFDPRQAFHPIPQNPQVTTVEVTTGCGGDSPPAGEMRAATFLPVTARASLSALTPLRNLSAAHNTS